ncbi:hypothetical protein Gekk315_00070 [Aeromonas phage Gekk3-15]
MTKIKLDDIPTCPHCGEELSAGDCARDFLVVPMAGKIPSQFTDDECGNCYGEYHLEYDVATEEVSIEPM